MRTKIIAGNLLAVLVVGLVSYAVVDAQLKSEVLGQVSRRIAQDHEIFERIWRLSCAEFSERTVALADAEETAAVYTAPNEDARHERAFARASAVAERFASLHRNTGRGAPELAVITDDRGRVIARSQDRNRMRGANLVQQLPTAQTVLRTGLPMVDVWRHGTGQTKLLQAAIAPVRLNGAVVGLLVVGYEMSNGMATQARELLGREVAIITEGSVYSSSFPGDRVAELRAALFDVQQASTRAALAADDGGARSNAWIANIGGEEFIGVTGSLPVSPSASVAYAVLANRTEALGLTSSLNLILILTLLGVVGVIAYGFLIANAFLKPLEEMEEGILAVINGRTDLRLDIESAELGGLAFRINQLLNVFTGTPEADDEGRVSSPPAWTESSPPSGDDDDDGDAANEALAARLAEEEEETYYARIFGEYVTAKQAAGEDVSNITQERFVQRLQANERSLIKKHGCRMVRFQVQIRGKQVNLQPVVIH